MRVEGGLSELGFSGFKDEQDDDTARLFYHPIFFDINPQDSLMNIISLNSKEIIKDLLLRLPDDISLHQIAQEIEFIAAIRQGISELERGESVSLEQIEQELPSWIMQ